MITLWIIVGALTLLGVIAVVSHVHTSRQLETAIEVNRVLYAEWQSIPVYVTDTDELQCMLPDCPTEAFFVLPGRRTSLRAIVVAISEHATKHHADEVAKWKAAQR